MRALLDVNVLIALFDAGHMHHTAAQNWMAREGKYGWASCPLTLNGCIRILSQPNYPGTAFPIREIVARLGEACQVNHQFWPDDLDPIATDLFQWQHVLGHRHLTDLYLLGLAVQNQGRFVSFDLRVNLQSVRGATAAHYAVIQ